MIAPGADAQRKCRRLAHLESKGLLLTALAPNHLFSIMANAGLVPTLRPFDKLRARRVPEFLYHYTSNSGLFGIVHSDSIWASKIQYLNDSQEFIGATERCASLLRERADRQTETWSKHLILFLAETLSRIESVNICVCSFTEESDLLSQWRGYCPPAGGYCLGIESQSLIKAFDTKNFTILPCVYDWSWQSVLLEDAIDTILPGLLNIPTVPPDQLPRLADQIVQWFLGKIDENRSNYQTSGLRGRERVESGFRAHTQRRSEF